MSGCPLPRETERPSRRKPGRASVPEPAPAKPPSLGYSVSNKVPAAQSNWPVALRLLPPLTLERSPLATFPPTIKKSLPPPLTLEKLPLAVLLRPPLTLEAWPPLAVLFMPPLTMEVPPLAVLLSPPLTLEKWPLAVLPPPPLTLEAWPTLAVLF